MALVLTLLHWCRYCSDRFSHINRCGWLTIISASTAAAMFVCAFSDINVLILGSLWMGFSYGGYWAVMPGILAELYGTKWFAVAYSVVSTHWMPPCVVESEAHFISASLRLGEPIATAMRC